LSIKITQFGGFSRHLLNFVKKHKAMNKILSQSIPIIRLVLKATNSLTGVTLATAARRWKD
jgi:hypothetical protein